MDGILLIDKPKDYTSRDIVNIVGKKFKTRKVGHAGTLDPLATGLLVVALGKGLKVISLLTNDKKEYIVEVKLGLKTDTLDVTGNVLQEVTDFSITKEEVTEVLHSFLGKSIQEVPIYSAVKIKGKKLYEYARNNEEVELPKREIEIFKIELLHFDKTTFSFKVLVSKGTYIRSLVRDIGKKLNIPCSMKNLRRTKTGIFNLEESSTLDDLESNNYKKVTIKETLTNYKIIEVDSYLEEKILNGRVLENRYNELPVVFINSNDEVLAIYEVYSKDNTKIKPQKVIKTSN